MNKIVDIIIIVILFLLIAIGAGKVVGIPLEKEMTNQKLSEDISGEDLEKALLLLFPGATSWEEVGKSIFEIYENRSKLGTIIYSAPYANSVYGFSGHTPLRIVLDEQDHIKSVELIENSETIEYVERVKEKGLLDEWINLTISEALEKQVDAVSGATYTSKGIIETLNITLSVYSESEWVRKKDITFLIRNLVLVLFIGFALFAFSKPTKTPRFRWILLILSISILGLWQGRMLSVSQFISWVVNGIPISMQWAMLLILILSIVIPMTTGKAFYCSYVCPFGALQDIASKTRKNKIRLGRRIVQWLQLIKRAILVGGLLLIAIGIGFDFSHIEPFTAFTPQAASWSAIAIAVFSVLLSVFIARPWCRFMCPTGEILEIIRRKKHTNKGNNTEPNIKKNMNKTVFYQVLSVVLILLLFIVSINKFMGKNNISQADEKKPEYGQEWQKIDPFELEDNPAKLFGKNWMALSVGKVDDMNAMTVSWGGFGTLWGMDSTVVTIYVRPDRYTYGFLMDNDHFTLTAFPEQYRNALAYLGSHSGRDGDKIAATGLTAAFTELGNPFFEEGRLVIECRRIYQDAFDPDGYGEEGKAYYGERSKEHGQEPPHIIIIGRVVNMWKK